jgi:hypothetical protein
MTRTTHLLVLILAIVLLDGFNRFSVLVHCYGQLQVALYDFTLKYKEPLASWYRATAQGASARDVVVRFEKKYGQSHNLTSGYFDLADVPLLEAYLEDRIPVLAPANRRFLGFETTFPIYCVLVLLVPPGLLVALAWNLARLRRIWLAEAPASSRLLDDLPILRAANKTKSAGALKAAIAVTVLVLVTVVPSLSLIAQQLIIHPAIKGELHVEPLGLPTVQDARVLLIVQQSDIAWAFMFILLVSIAISGFALSQLLRRKSSAISA